MIAGITTDTAGEWFAHARITERLLKKLLAKGRQAVIVADVPRRRYRVVNSRSLDLTSQSTFIVYGYADLVADLTKPEGFTWQDVAHNVDHAVLDMMDDWLADTVRVNPVVIQMRQAMRAQGFEINGRSWFREDGAVVDSYVYTPNMAVTLNLFPAAFGPPPLPFTLEVYQAYTRPLAHGSGELTADSVDATAEVLHDTVREVLPHLES
ncbi:hypothetical protein KIK06_14890 [Nocardiopsis sp. EMB25]|uniref:hypothetical protein n=1 Tax=Nocardiopsis sp. EMB25 TaxID=2835867 RepID=UPI00228410C9|nr:hypothetical protein [Nocardiopsis sp. EMB25]MCY9785169.1 hypothetical protein [Nocardiopsis sp. EMB25]